MRQHPGPGPVPRRSIILGSLATAVSWPLADMRSAFAQEAVKAAPPASAPAARGAVEACRDAILRISREVWANPELSLHEEVSSGIHLRELRAAGFTIASQGTSGIPTAFVAEWSQGQGGPKLGFLPEYDALPGLGNAAEPRPVPGPKGAEVGHGCGHNMLGAGCTGAAMALRRMMMEGGHPGTIRVYGCAAEETEGAKVYMARDGLFDDLDACLAWHPAPMTGTGLLRTAAMNLLRIRFRGRSAHAGVDPWEGRSALKGAEMFGIGVQFMREHLRPTTRLHYVYTDGGEAANVVPDRAAVAIVIRDTNRKQVGEVTGWVREVAEGAARATQTEVEIEQPFGLHDLLPNEVLVRRIHQHLSVVPIEWTPAEQDFARACQRESRLPEAGLATNLLPLLPEMQTGGSTDVGDVSYNAPTGLFAWATMPVGVGLHTWPVTACGGTSIGDKGAINSAIVMAGVGFDLMTDAGLRDQVKADFRKRRGGGPYVSPLPEGKKRPEGIPPRLLLRDGTGELTDEFYELGAR
ncbi:N-acyl-L-amino acid amidohydrolase [Roseomonas mucosa]|uniref:N-acyl-L-amino acid amidohydrolase n=1 Tax=Roseomonas mucosa TaxID=207340 RepID=A0A4Y1N1K1_9PROT|nr:N-acyl-L-amino acid amidohydrolase [Roseomonas mucosa]